MKRLTVLILIFAVILAGCQGNKQKNLTNQKSIEKTPGYPVQIVDLEGRSTTIEKKPQRIISLSPAVTEILYELGYGDSIVGVTEESDYPAKVKQKAKVGSYSDINIDFIKNLKPDIVFASAYTYQSMARTLQDQNIPVVYAEAKTYNGIFESVTLLSKIFSEENKGVEISNKIKQKVSGIRVGENPQKPNVLYIQSVEPLYVSGSKTLINDVIWLAGGVNAAQEIEGYNEMDKQKLSGRKIDIIVLSNKLPADINLDYFASHDVFKDLDAVKSGRVVRISNEELFTSAGLRIPKAIEEMKKLINNQ